MTPGLCSQCSATELQPPHNHQPSIQLVATVCTVPFDVIGEFKPNFRPHQILPHSIQTLYTIMHMHPCTKHTHQLKRTLFIEERPAKPTEALSSTFSNQHLQTLPSSTCTCFFESPSGRTTCSTTTSLTEIRQTTLGPLCVLAERGSLGTMVQVFWFQISMQQYTMK